MKQSIIRGRVTCKDFSIAPVIGKLALMRKILLLPNVYCIIYDTI